MVWVQLTQIGQFEKFDTKPCAGCIPTAESPRQEGCVSDRPQLVWSTINEYLVCGLLHVGYPFIHLLIIVFWLKLPCRGYTPFLSQQCCCCCCCCCCSSRCRCRCRCRCGCGCGCCCWCCCWYRTSKNTFYTYSPKMRPPACAYIASKRGRLPVHKVSA